MILNYYFGTENYTCVPRVGGGDPVNFAFANV